MKLIISAVGPNPGDNVDPRFGRASYLIQFDSDSHSFVAMDNRPQVDVAHGAGIQAAQKVVKLETDALVTGHCGPKAFAVLSEAGVKIYSAFQGTVLEAVRAWEQDELQTLTAPDGIGRH